MTPEQKEIQQQLGVLVNKAHLWLRRGALIRAVEKAMPVALLSLPVCPVLALLLGLADIVTISPWLMCVLSVACSTSIFALAFTRAVRGFSTTRSQCLALYDNALNARDRLRAADEFLACTSINGFQAAAIQDAKATIQSAVHYRFASHPPLKCAHRRRHTLAIALSMLAMLFHVISSTQPALFTDAENAGDNLAVTDLAAPPANVVEGQISADSDENKGDNTTAEAEGVRNNDTHGQTPNSAHQQQNHPRKHADRQAGGMASDGADSASGSATTESGRQSEVTTDNNKLGRQAENTSADTVLNQPQVAAQPQLDANTQANAGQSAESGAEADVGQSPQNGEPAEQGDDVSSDSQSGAQSAESEGERKNAASSPAAAATKGAKPASDPRKGRQEQQENQSGNQSNRNSQNSGNQSGDDGQKQSRGIGGLMLSVPMPDQFIGTPGPGPQQRKMQQTEPQKADTSVSASASRGEASGNLGQQLQTREDAWEKRLLESFYQRDKPVKSQQNNNRGQE